MRIALALPRSRGEGGFKKSVFLYERTRHFYENKEGHVQNEPKNKLFFDQYGKKEPDKRVVFGKTNPRVLVHGTANV